MLLSENDRRSAAPQRQHRARCLPHDVLCRRAKEQEIGHPTAMDAHDDQITVLLCSERAELRATACHGSSTTPLCRTRRALHDFVKTPAKSLLALFQKIASGHARIDDDAYGEFWNSCSTT